MSLRWRAVILGWNALIKRARTARRPMAASPHKPRRWRRRVLAGSLALFLGLNGVAWMQARAMLVFGPPGAPPRPLERMTWAEKGRAVLFGVQVPRPINRHTPRDLGLSYETRLIPLPSGKQLEAWFIPHQRPRGLVLLFHGYAMSKDALLQPAAVFAGMGYATLLVDFQGSGGSPGDDTTVGIREAGDVQASLIYARQQWADQPLIGYGFSMGAVALLGAGAIHGIQPDLLILEAPFDRMLHAIRTRFDALGLPAFPAAELVLLWGGAQLGFDGFDHNPADYARAITSPALLIHGSADQRVPAAQVDAVANSLAGFHRLVTIPNAGHEFSSLVAPERWRAEITDFLREAQRR